MVTDLKPTLWRTCRVLANPGRIRILDVLRMQGEQCVSQIAAACGMSTVRATQQLRALQARGLLRASRRSRWVFYRAQADPLVAHASRALTAVMKAITRGDSRRAMQAAFTVLTHERRIRIIQALAAGPLEFAALQARTHISTPALWRHLRKLRRRTVVIQDAQGCVQLAHLEPGLLRDFVRLALADNGDTRA